MYTIFTVLRLPIFGMYHMCYIMGYMSTFYYYVLLCYYVQLCVQKYDIIYFHLLICYALDLNLKPYY